MMDSTIEKYTFSLTINEENEGIYTSKLSVKKPNFTQPDFSNMIFERQEKMIIDDLVELLSGKQGERINFNSSYEFNNYNEDYARINSKAFFIAPGLNASLKSQIDEIFPVVVHHTQASKYIQKFSRPVYGLVNHALCAAIAEILKEFDKLLIRIYNEFVGSNGLSLSSFRLKIMNAAHTLEQIASLVSEISNFRIQDNDMDDIDDMNTILESLRHGCTFASAMAQQSTRNTATGSTIIKIIYDRAYVYSGDNHTKELLLMLGKAAEKPYIQMLAAWIYRGAIIDPYAEFMIRERKHIGTEKLNEDFTDEYWEKRYTIRDYELPKQLDNMKQKILLAGKYLNAITECGLTALPKLDKPFLPSMMDHNFAKAVEEAYKFANQSLLHFLISTHNLYPRMRSLKRYFFLDSSDFFTQFLDQASYELTKPAKSVQLDRLQNLLELALRQPGTVVYDDPFKDSLKVDLNNLSLAAWILRVVTVAGLEDVNKLSEKKVENCFQSDTRHFTGFYALQFDFLVPFPSSLVLSRKAILRYQLIFRHLLNLKYVQRSLEEAWQEHQAVFRACSQKSNTRRRNLMMRAFSLRARMLNFIQQLYFYITSEVLEPSWQKFQIKLQEIQTVDNLMQEHIDCLDTCLKECLLTNSRLVKIQAKLFNTCISFAMSQSHMKQALKSANREIKDDSRIMEKWEDYESKCEQSFDKNFKHFFDDCHYYANVESITLMSLVVRLDMN